MASLLFFLRKTHETDREDRPVARTRRSSVAEPLQCRQVGSLEQSEGFQDHRSLQSRVIRLPERISERKRDEQNAGRPYLAGHLFRHAEGDGGDARVFQEPLDQTHGLMAHRSDRDQQRHIYPVLLEPRGRFWSRLAQQSARSGDRTHPAQMPVAQAADDPLAD